MKYNYKVTYRLNYHPYAPFGFYSYICIASDAREAKKITRRRIGAQLSEKLAVKLVPAIPKVSHMSAHRLD